MYGPLAHLDIARQRHDELIRDAERHRLAARASDGRVRAGIASRLRGLVWASASSRTALEDCSKGSQAARQPHMPST